MDHSDLQVMMRERAASIPDTPDRLAAIHDRIRRDRRRRSTVVAGGMVAVVVLVTTSALPRVASDSSRVDPADRGPAADATSTACSRLDIASAASEPGDWQLARAWTATTTSAGQVPDWSPVPSGSIPAVERPALDAASAADAGLGQVVDGLRAYGVPFGLYPASDTPPDEVGDAGDYVYYSGVRLADVRFSGTCEPAEVPVSGTLRAYAITGGGILQCSLPLPTGSAFAAGTWAAQAARFCPVGSRASR